MGPILLYICKMGSQSQKIGLPPNDNKMQVRKETGDTYIYENLMAQDGTIFLLIYFRNNGF